MVIGVTEGFTIKQELVGVGYKAAVNGQLLELASVIRTTSSSNCLLKLKFQRLPKEEKTLSLPWYRTINNLSDR